MELVTGDNLDVKLYEHLLKGVVYFEYKKKDGTLRKAVGTINSTLVPENKKTVNDLIGFVVEAISVFELNGVNFTKSKKSLKEKMVKFINKRVAKLEGGTPRKGGETKQSYYDFTSNGWKAFTKASLVSFYV